ncbi:ATP-binding protein [Tsukamurella sp. PLM1]|uniref:sensor histidine kinase n=1 Tax=Tsukamurella sp. PLM1 TaxID=2929795 RepID=UPI002057C942|nr:ATP-binding protein [Tsukamurella sp. PLM1]BDH59114.1 ATP-binding protein [Tsukamurella sp. PLM1]
MRTRTRSVATQSFLAQVAVLLVIAAGASWLVITQARDDGDRTARAQTRAAAVALASSPSTVAALAAPDGASIAQPVAQRIGRLAGLDFVVIMRPDRTRLSHANPDLIGGKFTGTIDRALAGETFTETYAGSLGPSIRTVTPVYDASGTLVGLVSAGVTRARLGDQVRDALPRILAVVIAGLVVLVALSFLAERRLRRQTLGLSSDDLRGLYEHHDAVLHTLSEGLVVFDADAPAGPARVVNDEARRLLELPGGAVVRSDLPPSLQGEDDLTDELHVTASRVLLVNRRPVTGPTGPLGTVLTVRDRTELQTVLGELDTARSLAETLSAQAHEHANRLHSVITMIELGEGAAATELAVADRTASQGLIDRLAGDATPSTSALLVAKTAAAAALDVELTVAAGTDLAASGLPDAQLLTLVGNLVDNAIDAAGPGGWVELSAGIADGAWVLAVADSGPGMGTEEFARARTRGYSTKDRSDRAHGGGLGLALVDQLVRQAGGTIAAHRGPSTVTVTMTGTTGGAR